MKRHCTPAQRNEIVLRVLSGKSTVEIESEKSGVSTVTINRWIQTRKKADSAKSSKSVSPSLQGREPKPEEKPASAATFMDKEPGGGADAARRAAGFSGDPQIKEDGKDEIPPLSPEAVVDMVEMGFQFTLIVYGAIRKVKIVGSDLGFTQEERQVLLVSATRAMPMINRWLSATPEQAALCMGLGVVATALGRRIFAIEKAKKEIEEKKNEPFPNAPNASNPSGSDTGNSM